MSELSRPPVDRGEVTTQEVLDIPSHLRSQLENGFSQLQNVTGLSAEAIETPLTKAINYIGSRHTRAAELRSREVTHARTLAAHYFDEPIGDTEFVGWNVCMDMGTRKTIQAGVPGRFGGSLRYPGGKPMGFSREGRRLKLDPRSEYAKNLRGTYRGNPNIMQVLDSHKICKAREEEEFSKRGTQPPDRGLLKDVVFKNEMVDAIQRYSDSLDAKPDSLKFVQVSFTPRPDPRDTDNQQLPGFMDFGLHRQQALSFANLHGDGFYTLETLIKMRKEGIIVSSQVLAQHDLAELFQTHTFDYDLLKNYSGSLLQFWNNINSMKNRGLQIVKKEFNTIYGNTPQSRQEELTREMEARMAFVSAYSGYLNNLKPYQFKDHTESILMGLNGGDHGPFNHAEALELYRDNDFLLNEGVFSTSIIRDNRANRRAPGKVEDPVPFGIQARISTGIDHEKMYAFTARIQELLPRENWMGMTYQELIEFAVEADPDRGREEQNVHGVSADVASEFAKMVIALQRIYNPANPAAEVVYAGGITPFGVFVDSDRDPLGALFLTPKGA